MRELVNGRAFNTASGSIDVDGIITHDLLDGRIIRPCYRPWSRMDWECLEKETKNFAKRISFSGRFPSIQTLRKLAKGEKVMDTNGTEGSGSSSSELLTSIFSDAASVTNTAIIANANPVNAAILTNTPLTTANASVGATSSSSLLWLLVAAAVVFVIVAMSGK
jgi:hypothetical protein